MLHVENFAALGNISPAFEIVPEPPRRKRRSGYSHLLRGKDRGVFAFFSKERLGIVIADRTAAALTLAPFDRVRVDLSWTTKGELVAFLRRAAEGERGAYTFHRNGRTLRTHIGGRNLPAQWRFGPTSCACLYEPHAGGLLIRPKLSF